MNPRGRPAQFPGLPRPLRRARQRNTKTSAPAPTGRGGFGLDGGRGSGQVAGVEQRFPSHRVEKNSRKNWRWPRVAGGGGSEPVECDSFRAREGRTRLLETSSQHAARGDTLETEDPAIGNGNRLEVVRW